MQAASADPLGRPAGASIPAHVSASMRIARVICILGLVYVHVPPWHIDLGQPPRALTLFDGLFVLFQEAFGRSSVPLLSIVSGYLLARQTDGKTWAARLGRKIPTLLTPLVLWNTIDVALDIARTRHLPAGPPLALANLFLALTTTPSIIPLYFLRDILLCVALYPIVRGSLRRWPRSTFVILTLLSLFNITTFLFIGPSLLLFFTLGVGLGLGVVTRPHLPLPGIVAGAAAAALAATALNLALLSGALAHSPAAGLAASAIQLVERLFGAALFWGVASRLRQTTLGALASAVEPAIFFLFCVHPLILGAMWRIFEHGFGGYESPAYPAFFFLSPALVLAVALVLTRVLLWVAPRSLSVLCGGRLPQIRPLRQVRPTTAAGSGRNAADPPREEKTA